MSRKGGKTPTIRTKNMWFTILSKARHDFTVLLQLNNTERIRGRKEKERKLSNPKNSIKIYLQTLPGDHERLPTHLTDRVLQVSVDHLSKLSEWRLS